MNHTLGRLIGSARKLCYRHCRQTTVHTSQHKKASNFSTVYTGIPYHCHCVVFGFQNSVRSSCEVTRLGLSTSMHMHSVNTFFERIRGNDNQLLKSRSTPVWDMLDNKYYSVMLNISQYAGCKVFLFKKENLNCWLQYDHYKLTKRLIGYILVSWERNPASTKS